MRGEGPSRMWLLGVAVTMLVMTACASREPTRSSTASPEQVVRNMLQANADRDLPALEALVARDMIGYTIGARRYAGWDALAREMEQEFQATSRIEIPIKQLRVRERGDVAWFTVEIDYIRTEGSGLDRRTMVLPLRESGVLERRDGRWLLVQWHESANGMPRPAGESNGSGSTARRDPDSQIDLSGEWDIREEDRSYRALLDAAGNGTYTWQGGTLRTTRVADGHWEGTWHQTGNDREGGFEVILSGDHSHAEGRWWYTRVGNREVPPRQWGGSYRFTKVDQLPRD